MSEIKQVIVMRTDLNMRKGKMIAQGGHASSKALLDLMMQTESTYVLDLVQHNLVKQWVESGYKKVCVGIGSEEGLNELQSKALLLNVPCCVITDNGITEFHGIKTKTCLALGPYHSNIIDEISGLLKLL